MPRPSPILSAYLEINRLKGIPRTGWLRRGVEPGDCESVADHSLGVAALAMLIMDAHRTDLDAQKVLRMALLHDVGEARVGDLTPADGVTTEEKHRREASAVEEILGELPGGVHHLALWGEYERGESPEARFVRQVDKLEMALQAAAYERQGSEGLDEFFESARQAIDDPVLAELLDSIRPVLSR